MKSLITITFAERVENHAGMQIIGKEIKEGITNLTEIYNDLKSKGIVSELVDLKGAYILVIRQGIELCGTNNKNLYQELIDLEWDKKAFMYGRVVNKHARHNLCFDDVSQKSDFENGKGSVINFKILPILQKIRDKLPFFFGDKAKNLKAEGNLYYDISKTGIGWHGDAERKIVIGVRVGNGQFPLYYQWYQKGEKVGERFKIEINPGDIYIMDQKATGNDWKLKNVKTLRHATGCLKFIKGKEKKKNQVKNGVTKKIIK